MTWMRRRLATVLATVKDQFDSHSHNWVARHRPPTVNSSACQEHERGAGWVLSGTNLADVGRRVLRVEKSRSRVLSGALWEEMMKALVFHGPGLKGLEDRPKPEIKAPSDAIVKVVKTTICGTDLHILK